MLARLALRLLPAALVAASVAVVGPAASAGGASADLSVALAVGPAAVEVGDDVTVSLSVDNAGPGTAEDVLLQVDLDPALVPVVPDGCGTDPGGFSCPLGDLSASSGVVLPDLAATAVAPGTLEVTATVSSSTSDPDPTDDVAAASVEATGEACEVVGTQDADALVAPMDGAVVCGLGGADHLLGGPGDDSFLGGSGRDIASFATAAGAVEASLVTGAATGAGADVLDDIEWLIGGPLGDDLEGDGLANTLDGASGPDSLRGKAGADLLLGGPGADELDGGLGRDEAAFPGVVPVRVDLAAHTVTGRGGDTITGVEDVLGGDSDDVLAGTGAGNELRGGPGHDVLIGRGGADTLRGGLGADTLHAGAGDDTLFGGPGTDGCVQGVGAGPKTGCQVVAYAQYGDLVVFEPHVDTVGFGFHESLFPSAEVLRPLGTLDLNANKAKYPDPPPPTDGPGYVVMGTRGRSTHPTSATDIVVPRSGVMRAPVTGTVVEVAIYQLYCDRPDWKVIIKPQTDPTLRVLVLHMVDPFVEEGDRVIAGVTQIGQAAVNDPPTSQENDYFPDQYPHVHIEVEHVGAVKGPCGA